LRGSGARLLGRHWRRAQKRALPVIGYIGGLDQGRGAFLKGLAEAGYVEGRDVAIEYRWVEAHNERLPGFVSDRVGRRVALITVMISTAAALAAKAATQTIPIVFRIGDDPVASGLAPSLARPGGNVTGLTTPGVHCRARECGGFRRLRFVLSRAVAYGDILPCACRCVGAPPAISPSNTLRM
jgi:putative tryptophan/tyrosine transport system substrate-binding protein